MWRYYKGLRSGIWDGVTKQRGLLSNSPYLPQLNPWPFWHPPTASYTKPPGMTLLSKARGCRCREGQRMAPLKCYSKWFCHKRVNLFHVFIRHRNSVLLCIACHHCISCSLQTIRRCWTYFKSVFRLARQVGETGLKLKQSCARPFSSKITLSVSECVCFQRIPLTITLITDILIHYWHRVWYTVNGIRTFRLDENNKLDAWNFFPIETCYIDLYWPIFFTKYIHWNTEQY